MERRGTTVSRLRAVTIAICLHEERTMSRKSVLCTFALFVCLVAASTALAQIPGPVEVIAAAQHDVSEELRAVPPKPAQPGQRVVPVYQIPHSLEPKSPDPALQTETSTTAAPVTLSSFDGVGAGFAGPNGTFSVGS